MCYKAIFPFCCLSYLGFEYLAVFSNDSVCMSPFCDLSSPVPISPRLHRLQIFI